MKVRRRVLDFADQEARQQRRKLAMNFWQD